jgi:hypothetical protein
METTRKAIPERDFSEVFRASNLPGLKRQLADGERCGALTWSEEIIQRSADFRHRDPNGVDPSPLYRYPSHSFGEPKGCTPGLFVGWPATVIVETAEGPP